MSSELLTSMPKIFISYRRVDSRQIVERIHDRLSAYYGKGNVFLDVDLNIPYGSDFADVLRDNLEQSDVLLVIMGREWTNELKRRADGEDFVRLEVETGLRQIPLVIPVQVNNAPVPSASDLPDSMQGLLSKNFLELLPNPYFNTGMAMLTNTIDEAFPKVVATPPEAQPTQPTIQTGGSRLPLIAIVGIVLLLLAGLALVASGALSPAPASTPTVTLTEALSAEEIAAQLLTQTSAPTITVTDDATQTIEAAMANLLSIETENARSTEQQSATETADAQATIDAYTDTPQPSDTPTETDTPTPTDTPTATVPPTETPTETPSHTPTDTPTATPDLTETAIIVATDNQVGTAQAVVLTDESSTQIAQATADAPTNTPQPTATLTETPSDTPTHTPTDTPSFTPTLTPTDEPTATPTPTHTPTATLTPSNTPTETYTPSPTVDTTGTAQVQVDQTATDIAVITQAFEQAVATENAHATETAIANPVRIRRPLAATANVRNSPAVNGGLIETLTGGFIVPIGDLVVTNDAEFTEWVEVVDSGYIWIGVFTESDQDDIREAFAVTQPNTIEVDTSNNISFKGHESDINALEFSPNGEWLATASTDRTIRIWDTNTYEEQFQLTGHNDWVNAIAFSPDGQYLASGGGLLVKVWDVITGEEVWSVRGHGNSVMSVAFSPDGSLIASSGWDATIKLWDATTGDELLTLSPNAGWVWDVVFSPDGTTLASAHDDASIRFWDVALGIEISRLTGHANSVMRIEYANADILASASRDNTIRLWNPISGDVLLSTNADADIFNGFTFVNDGTQILFRNPNTAIRVWTLDSEQVNNVINSQAEVDAFTVARHANLLAYSDPSGNITVSEFSLDDASMDESAQAMPDTTSEETVSDNTSLSAPAVELATGTISIDIEMRDAPAGTFIGNISAGAEVIILDDDGEWAQVLLYPDFKSVWVSSPFVVNRQPTNYPPDVLAIFSHIGGESVRVSRDGRSFYTVSYDTDTATGSTLFKWDSQTGENLLATDFSLWVSPSHLTPSEQYLVIPVDESIQVFNTVTGDLKHTINNSGQIVEILEGEQLITLRYDFTHDPYPSHEYTLWDITTGELLHTFTDESMLSWAESTISSDETLLATVSFVDTQIRLWDIETGDLLRAFGNHRNISTIAFSPDGSLILTASTALDDIKLWDIATGEAVYVLNNMFWDLDIILFSPDGSWISTGDGVILDAATGQRQGVERLENPYVPVWAPDSQSVITYSYRIKALSRWDVETGELIRSYGGLLSGSFDVDWDTEIAIVQGSGYVAVVDLSE